MKNLIAVACGGAIGSVLRYAVAGALHGTHFALATLIVNVVGCFLLGALVSDGVVTNERLAFLAHPALTVGLLGGLTTFSTFGFQTMLYVEQRHFSMAALNVVSNVALGLLAVWAGMALSRHFGPAVL